MITYVDIWGMGDPVFGYIEESYRHLSPLLPYSFSISSWREEACPPGLLLHSDKADSSDVSYLLISCGMDGLLFVLCFLLVFSSCFFIFSPSATLCSLSPVLCAAGQAFQTNLKACRSAGDPQFGFLAFLKPVRLRHPPPTL